MSDLATRLANTGQLLVYSGIEIDRILNDMVNNHSTISTSLPGQDMFLSRIVIVDPVKQRLLIAEADSQTANTSLIKMQSVNFRCHHRLGQLAFACRRPRRAKFQSQPAIEMDSPTIVLAVQHNKKVVRTAVPKSAPDLRCQLPIGLVSVEARLVDMSLDGHAFLLGYAGIPLCAGTWVRGARITPQGETPVTVDIEMKYVIPTTLPDGERATRMGCRIVGTNDVMERIVNRFIMDWK